MGCTTSKLENEDTVWRCKERRRLMKDAVYARYHLCTAHSDYCRSLRVTGAVLVSFASGEPLISSHHAPAVLLRGNSSSARGVDSVKTDKFVSTPRHQIPPISPSPPPPPLSVASSEGNQPQAPPIRRKKPVKLPHILSDSSFSSSPPRSHNFTYNAARANSTYSSTPSQASSVWNWDNFYPPPSPPDSEYFQKLHNKAPSTHKDDHSDYDNSDYENEEKASTFRSYSDSRDHGRQFMKSNQLDDQASNHSTYSRYPESHSKSYTAETHEIPHKKGQNLTRWDSEEEETDREEVQCSEWGDHDHYSSSSDEDLKSRSDFGRGKNEGAPAPAEMGTGKGNSGKLEKLSSEEDEKSSDCWGIENHVRMNLDRRIVLRHQNLSEILAAIKEYFDKAASAGEQVSEILEIGRAQFDRSFKQLKKTVYHSSGMLSALSSTWSSKPPLAVKYQFDPVALEQPGSTKSLSSTLERLLAWEKKLYEEVKAREGVKIEHEKKLSSLQNQEYRGEEEAKLDKTKASIQRLQSLIVVTSQAVLTTSSSIIELRDSNLLPQLVELCHGFMYMWRSMNQFHEAQNDIVQQVRGLVSQVNKGDYTSDLHRQATCYLESAVSEWHLSFCRLIKFQRDFIRSLHGWFKLTFLPVTSEPSNATRDLSKVFSFMDEWKLALDRVPDTVASEAIKSFINVVHSISLKQTEELKIKKRTEIVSRELEKKASSLRNIEKKYYLSYSTIGIGLPDSGTDNGHVFDARDPLAEKKAELAICQTRVEDEMLRHSRAVEVTRAMTLNNLQTGLPGVFQAMTGFSALISESLQSVCNHSYDIY